MILGCAPWGQVPELLNIEVGLEGPYRFDYLMRMIGTRIAISEQLVAQIDELVGKGGRSAFLTQAAEKELMHLRQIKALQAAAGIWKDKDHPELKQGATKWVKKLRREYDRRLERVTTQWAKE